jgi:hypothetical protein
LQPPICALKTVPVFTSKGEFIIIDLTALTSTLLELWFAPFEKLIVLLDL